MSDGSRRSLATLLLHAAITIALLALKAQSEELRGDQNFTSVDSTTTIAAATPAPPPTPFIPTETPRPAMIGVTPAPTAPAPTDARDSSIARRFEMARTVTFAEVLEGKERVAELWWVLLLSFLFIIGMCVGFTHLREGVERHRTSLAYLVYRAVAKNYAVAGLCAAVINAAAAAVADVNELWAYLLYTAYLTLFLTSVVLVVKLCLVISRAASLVDEWAAWEVHLPRGSHDVELTGTLSARLPFVNDVRYILLHQLHLMYPHRAVLEQDVRATSYIRQLQGQLMLELVSVHWKNWLGVALFVLLNTLRQAAVLNSQTEITLQVQIDDAASFVFALGYLPSLIYFVYYFVLVRQCRAYLRKARDEVRKKVAQRERETFRRAVKEYHEAMLMADLASADVHVGSARHNILKQKALANYKPSAREIALQSRLEPPMAKNEFLDSFSFIWFGNTTVAMLTFKGCVLINAFYLAYFVASGMAAMVLTEISFGPFFFVMALVPSAAVFWFLPWSSLLLIMATSLGPYLREDIVRPLVFVDSGREALPSRRLAELRKGKRRTQFEQKLLRDVSRKERLEPDASGALDVPLLERSDSVTDHITGGNSRVASSFASVVGVLRRSVSNPLAKLLHGEEEEREENARVAAAQLAALQRAEDMNLDGILDAMEDVDDDCDDEIIAMMQRAMDGRSGRTNSRVEELPSAKISNPLLREPIAVGDLVQQAQGTAGIVADGARLPSSGGSSHCTAASASAQKNRALVARLRGVSMPNEGARSRGEVELPQLSVVRTVANTMTDSDVEQLHALLHDVLHREPDSSPGIESPAQVPHSSRQSPRTPGTACPPSPTSPHSSRARPSLGRSLRDLTPHELQQVYRDNLVKVIRVIHRMRRESLELHERIVAEAAVRRIQEEKLRELLDAVQHRPDLRVQWQQRAEAHREAEAVASLRMEGAKKQRRSFDERARRRKEREILRKVQVQRRRERFGGLTAASFQRDGFYFGDWEGAHRFAGKSERSAVASDRSLRCRGGEPAFLPDRSSVLDEDDEDDEDEEDDEVERVRLTLGERVLPTAEDVLASLVDADEEDLPGATTRSPVRRRPILPPRTIPQVADRAASALQRHMQHAVASAYTVDYDELAAAEARRQRRAERELRRMEERARRLNAKRAKYLAEKQRKEETEHREATRTQSKGRSTMGSAVSGSAGAAVVPSSTSGPLKLPSSQGAAADDPFADSEYVNPDADGPQLDIDKREAASSSSQPPIAVVTGGPTADGDRSISDATRGGSSEGTSQFGSSFNSFLSQSPNTSVDTPTSVTSSSSATSAVARHPQRYSADSSAAATAADRARRRARYKAIMDEKKRRLINRERAKRQSELDFSSWGLDEPPIYVADLHPESGR